MKPGTHIIVTRGDHFTGHTGEVLSVTQNGKLWVRLDTWPDGVRRLFSGERCDEMLFEIDEVAEHAGDPGRDPSGPIADVDLPTSEYQGLPLICSRTLVGDQFLASCSDVCNFALRAKAGRVGCAPRRSRHRWGMT